MVSINESPANVPVDKEIPLVLAALEKLVDDIEKEHGALKERLVTVLALGNENTKIPEERPSKGTPLGSRLQLIIDRLENERRFIIRLRSDIEL